MVEESKDVIKMIDETGKDSKKMESSKVTKTDKKSSGKDVIKSFKAKKDHRIVHNGVDLQFVKGEVYDDISVKWETTLSVEGVL